MDIKPTIKIELTISDILLEIIGYFLLVLFWIFIISNYQTLPESIPIHYNGLGEVDNYGKKTSIFLLPIIGSLLFLMLSVLNQSPENFNYKVKITLENAEKQYKNAITMMRFLKIIVVVLFFLIDFETIQIANGKSEGLGVWFLSLTIPIILLPMFYFAFKSNKMK